MCCMHWGCVTNVKIISEGICTICIHLPQRDQHPTLSWQDAGLLTGCVIISDDKDASMEATEKDEDEVPDIEILEEPTKNAIKNQAISRIRLIQQGLRIQEQGLEIVKGSAIEELPNILCQMMRMVSIN